MKRFLGWLLVVISLSGTVQAAAYFDVPVVLQYEEIYVDQNMDGITLDVKQQNRTYPLLQLKNFTLLDHIIEDLGIESITSEEPLPILLKQATPKDFDLLLYMADQAEKQNNVVLPVDVEQNIDRLVALWMLAKFLDPKKAQTLYPITLAIITYVGMLDNAGKIRILSAMDNDAVSMLLDNFADLMVDTDDMQNTDGTNIIIRNMLRVICKTDYLLQSLRNTQAQLLIDGVKRRAIKDSYYTKLTERIQNYIFDDRWSEELFPVPVPSQKPVLKRFPLSIQDLLDSGLMPDAYLSTETAYDAAGVSVSVTGKRLSLVKQGLTSLEGLANIPDVKEITMHLDLSNNFIETVSEGTFLAVPLLRELELGFNKISSFDKDCLTYFKNIKLIGLSNNQLFMLQENSFVDLPHLEIIHLNNNNIEVIQTGAFKNLPRLQSVDLSNNLLTSLSPDFFINTPSLKLTAFENPWSSSFLESDQIKTLEQDYGFMRKMGIYAVARYVKITNQETNEVVWASRDNGYISESGLLKNPETGELIFSDDPKFIVQQGYFFADHPDFSRESNN